MMYALGKPNGLDGPPVTIYVDHLFFGEGRPVPFMAVFRDHGHEMTTTDISLSAAILSNAGWVSPDSIPHVCARDAGITDNAVRYVLLGRSFSKYCACRGDGCTDAEVKSLRKRLEDGVSGASDLRELAYAINGLAMNVRPFQPSRQ